MLFVIRQHFEMLDKKPFYLLAIFSILSLIPIMNAEASSNPNLFVSAENSQFNNYFSGSMVIEVVIRDPNLHDTDQGKGEPELVKNVREISTSTEGVIDANPILMRRSGDTFFVDITISLRGDTSFDKAHEISNNVERNIKNKISNAAITIHFEPNWKNVPLDTKILDIAKSVDGVKEVHNVSTHKSNGKTYSDLHVMVHKDINLLSAHNISEIVEQKIQENIPEIEHATIHLEPFVTVPEKFNLEDKIVEEEIRTVLEKYPEIKKIGRIVSLNFENILKIDIDCSFDKELSIEKVHDLTSKIEHVIRTQIKNAVITIHPEPD